ncbi:MAG: hypothetical protein AAF447_22065 [Myxococcota bacterium]
MSRSSAPPETPAAETPASAFAALARRVAAVPDVALRIGYVTRAIEAYTPERLAAELDVVVEGVARTPHQATLLLSVVVALQDPRHATLRREASAWAQRRGRVLTAGLLYPAHADVPEDGALPVPDFRRGRPITLGERKALARGRDRTLLQRVLRDPHPDVVHILLGNPALTEPDVVRLLARRPAHPDALAAVFRSPRWVVRYAVRSALLQNPHCPRDIALACVALLRRSDARRLTRAASLHPAIRAACAHAARSPTLH